MAKIKEITAYQIISGKGIPSLEIKLTLDNDEVIKTSIPKDKKINSQYAYNLSDNDSEVYDGHGLSKPINLINNLIGPKLKGVDPLRQNEVDGWLKSIDSTTNKSKLGVNTIFILSMAIAKSAAKSLHTPLYKYLNEIFNKRSGIDQPIERITSPIISIINKDYELLLIPSTSNTYLNSINIAIETNIYFYKNFKPGSFYSYVDAIEALIQTLDTKNYKLGRDVFFGINFKGSLKQDNTTSIISNLIKKYLPLLIIDPTDSSNFDSWKVLTDDIIPKETYLASDFITSSNSIQIEKALKDNIISSFILKPYLVGTLTELVDLTNLIKNKNGNYFLSASDYETTDSSLADISIALQSEFVKFGPFDCGEYAIKYNRMLEIEKEISNKK